MSAPCPVFGFVVALRLVPGQDDTDVAHVWADLIRETIEPRGLVCDREPASRDAASRVVRSEAAQATEADRQAVLAWTSARREIHTAHVGPLVDLASVA